MAPSDLVPTIAALAVAVFAIAPSAPLIAYAAAPALAIACWRNTFAVGVLAPVAVTVRRRELATAGRSALAASLLAGTALAVHFGTWVPSAKLTGVAASTALVATQPVWQGLIALGQGRRPPAGGWAGLGVPVRGARPPTRARTGPSRPRVPGDPRAP